MLLEAYGDGATDALSEDDADLRKSLCRSVDANRKTEGRSVMFCSFCDEKTNDA